MITSLALPWLLVPTLLTAPPPMRVDVQGMLTTVGGQPATDGSYALTIAFYENESGGAAVYTDYELAVPVVDGRFSVRVGSAIPLNVAAFEAASVHWVGVTVGNEPELPRQPLGVVPYAIRAEVAGDLRCTECIATSELSAEVLAPYARLADLSAVALSGSWTDLVDKPVLVAPNQSCTAGSVVTGVSATGSITCAPDKDTTYSGANFANSGQGCAVGSVVTGLDLSGGVVCAVDKDTTYSGANFALSAQACSPGSVVTGVGSSGAVTCAADKDTTYTGATFALSNQGCTAGSVVTGISSTGGVTCAADKNNSYDGTSFALSNQACAVGQVVAGVSSTGAVTCTAVGATPIGSIVAWHKNLGGTPALPSGWLECNGQVVADTSSPLNGTTLPSLNTENRFLRGAATSGAVGGSETHVHSFSQTNVDMAPDASTNTSGSYTNPSNHLPPYLNIVWIIRVR